MKDQTLSNTIYGLGLLGVQWATLESEFRDVLVMALKEEAAFGRDVSQHISNSLWALAKMDADWNDMPNVQLEEAFNRCVHSLSAQEICNSIYGFAILDAAWTDLSLLTKRTIVDALKRNAEFLDHQEVANVMYSLSLLTFDAVGAGDWSGSGSGQDDESSALMWEVHRTILSFYCTLDPANYSKENYDQFAMYFEMMSVNEKVTF